MNTSIKNVVSVLFCGSRFHKVINVQKCRNFSLMENAQITSTYFYPSDLVLKKLILKRLDKNKFLDSIIYSVDTWNGKPGAEF